MNRETQVTEKPKHRFWSLMLAIILIAIIIWQWPTISNQFVKIQQSINDYFDEIDALGEKKQALMAEVAATQQTAKDRLSQYEARLAELQKTQDALDAISQESPDDPLGAILEAIEQQILIAKLHLQLGGTEAALSALHKALEQAQQLDEDQFSSLFTSLSQEIENLNAASSLDIKEIAAHLDDLSGKAETLPLIIESSLTEINIGFMPEQQSANVTNISTWQKLLNEMWQDVAAFIKVEKVSRPAIQILSPSQIYFLRENLKLKFLLMRFSLLSRNYDSFTADLRTAVSWINQYFDKNAESVAQVLQVLAQLQQIDNIGFELPDFSASLELIHNYRIKRNEENK